MAEISTIASGKQLPKREGVGKPNFNVLHSRLLPLELHPLPPLIPHNPLSVLHVVFVYVRQLLLPPTSPSPYEGVFSPETCSVHITDRATIRALWEHGFFGKGSLSRSDPTWLQREKRRRGLVADETSEEVTSKRREERKAFKRERARRLQKEIEHRQMTEANQNVGAADGLLERPLVGSDDENNVECNEEPRDESLQPHESLITGTMKPASSPLQQLEHGIPGVGSGEPEITNEEHLQLDFCEAFFLAYGLGALKVISTANETSISTVKLFLNFMAYASFPPSPLQKLEPDNTFVLLYLVYHHFRSLGWVTRPGIKFGVDFLLYNRGPVFSHAEFAVIILPAYSHPYWKGNGKAQKAGNGSTKRWHWLHMVNRVQSQVRKTLVLCFVEIPPPWTKELLDDQQGDIGKVLKMYKIREITLRRWIPNRTRD